MSEMECSLYLICKICALKRFPRHTGHGTSRSFMKYILVKTKPSPWQCSQRPPCVLKEKSFGFKLLCFASGSPANKLRMNVNTSVYVAILERCIRPSEIGRASCRGGVL